MIIYDICCDKSHRFEGWFREANDYQKQLASGLISCPECGSLQVKKVPTASRIQTGSTGRTRAATDESSDSAAAMSDFAGKLQQYVAANYTDVGEQFPEEARKVFYGETKARNLLGTAKENEISELLEEGIAVMSLPVSIRNTKKLN